MQPKVILIDGVVGTGPDEISSNWFASQLPTDKSPIVVKIHSEGGSVTEGFRIFDLAKAYEGPKKAVIESAAYSISSFIPMAFDETEITPNGYMMVHNPYMGVEGDDEELANKSQFLAKLKTNMVAAYCAKTGLPEESVLAIMKRETEMNATEAVASGFADRITSAPVIGRAFAKLNSMPHGVVAALFGVGSGGNQEPPTKVKPMSDSTPVAATLQEIETAFPKASAEFVVKCLKRSMPMASVASAAVEEMMAENEGLRAQIKAMEEEMAKAKAELPTEEEPAASEGEEEEEPAEAKAVARGGVKPIAKAKTGGPSAQVRWDSAIDACLPKCKGNRTKAVAMANRANPGLREAMIAEVNSRPR
jgi:ATP-dependent protease ClpP protease subunit